MYGSMEAEYEVQRTIKRVELIAFLWLRQERVWTHQGPCGQQPKAGDAGLWIKIWEEPHEPIKKRHFGVSGTCKGAPHEERKRKDDAI